MACCIISDRPNISIHALLTESDLFYCFFALCYVISIHALLTESDVSFMLYDTTALIFLSTLSLRRATSSNINSSSIIAYFYPRSPYGERHAQDILTALNNIFLSTLSLRRATPLPVILSPTHQFLSTLSLRRATLFLIISLPSCDNFYPRSPYGERHISSEEISSNLTISIHALLTESDGLFMLYDTTALIFLSTLSLRRATHQ